MKIAKQKSGSRKNKFRFRDSGSPITIYCWLLLYFKRLVTRRNAEIYWSTFNNRRQRIIDRLPWLVHNFTGIINIGAERESLQNQNDIGFPQHQELNKCCSYQSCCEHRQKFEGHTDCIWGLTLKICLECSIQIAIITSPYHISFSIRKFLPKKTCKPS